MLFDMDGTLTAPYFDFDAIRREVGTNGQPILEAIAQMDSARRQAALDILHRHEDECAANCELNPGCEELIEWLISRHVKLAVVTRNTLKSASTVFTRHRIAIDTLITRDDGVFKPAPDPLLLACRRLEVSPADTWMIGDGQYDVEAGHAAGMRTIWLNHGQPREFAVEPDVVVRDLLDFRRWLSSSS
jgi:HAD superfamily hydrolase (TIGR01509 family)